MKPLLHSDYAKEISLFSPFDAPRSYNSSVEKGEAVDRLLSVLKEPLPRLGITHATSYAEKRRLLHAVLNTLEPGFLEHREIHVLDRLLQTELAEKELPDLGNLYVNTDGLALFQGDITTLQVDAIVNAANSQLLGCFQPLHACIDNAIHSAAGVRLRDDCDWIMQKQGVAEPTAEAKITRAYNLPSKFVIHTVGPIVQDELTIEHERLLEKVYFQCLELAAAVPEIRSLAFCCISTGVFGYPQDQAAQTAFSAVTSWLKQNPGKLNLVVFNVFTDKDLKLYQALMEES